MATKANKKKTAKSKKPAKKKVVKKRTVKKKTKAKPRKPKPKMPQNATIPVVANPIKSEELKLNEIQEYMMYMSGTSQVDIAKMRGIDRGTVIRHIEKAKRIIGKLPSVQRAREGIEEMVPAAQAVLWNRLAMNDGNIAIKILVSTRAMDLAPGELPNDNVHKSDAEIFGEIVKMMMESGDPTLIGTIREIINESPGQVIETTAEVVSGDPKKTD